MNGWSASNLIGCQLGLLELLKGIRCSHKQHSAQIVCWHAMGMRCSQSRPSASTQSQASGRAKVELCPMRTL